MTELPFAKLHGQENDFILSWASESPETNWPELARRICARSTGIGADGWMLLWPQIGGLRTQLFNSDGSEAEISGNGTRCAAAFALIKQAATPPLVTITTAAGPKSLYLISQQQYRFMFEMDMGRPHLEEMHATLHLNGRDWDATLLNVGNPQCAIFIDQRPEDWRVAAAQAEAHPDSHTAQTFPWCVFWIGIQLKWSFTNGALAKLAVPEQVLQAPPPLLF